jgi:clusterin-associated protein 1
MARVLSYPRLISMENFRQPNFRLVAELMTWLVKQYDPLADVPNDTEGEQDRVIFIRTVAQIIVNILIYFSYKSFQISSRHQKHI